MYSLSPINGTSITISINSTELSTASDCRRLVPAGGISVMHWRLHHPRDKQRLHQDSTPIVTNGIFRPKKPDPVYHPGKLHRFCFFSRNVLFVVICWYFRLLLSGPIYSKVVCRYRVTNNLNEQWS